MKRTIFSPVLTLLLLFAMALTARGQPRFARIFSDHAVLQQGREVPVWGFGAVPGMAVRVEFGNVAVRANVDRVGNWKAALPARKADARGRDLTLLADGEIVERLEDVVVGEVWLAAGQSNMQFPVRQMSKQLPVARNWVASADVPMIRMRRINDPVLKERNASAGDINDSGGWVRMSPESVLSFSAVAAVFARELNASRKVPIGVVDVSWGGKPIEPFIPRGMFHHHGLNPILKLANEERLDELAKLQGGVIIRNPQGYPGAIFNARIRPLIPYAIKGCIWYQAESNCGRGEDPRGYRTKQRALIEGWRGQWQRMNLPFYYVQLPSFPNATGWVRMREEQRLALDVPHTGMAVSIDIRGEGIHPPDKLSVGKRLAKIALARTYGVGGAEVTGPMYDRYEVRGAEVTVHFRNVGKGLMVGDKLGAGRPEEITGGEVEWFELADDNGNWHPAAARIHGNVVRVKSAGIKRPVAVRYACQVQPQGKNLYNRAGFPASPFCSDLELLPWEDHGLKN